MINFIKNHSIFKDQQAVLLMGVAGFILLIILIYSGFAIESRTFKVDVRYSGYDRSLSDKGEWYSLYIFPLFAVLMYLINSYAALKAHHLQRMLSIMILGFNIIVMLFAFLVSRALFNLL